MDQKIYFCFGLDVLFPSEKDALPQPAPGDAAENQRLVDLSAQIYDIYLSFFSKDDIYIAPTSEAYIDVTGYMGLYRQSPRALARAIAERICAETGQSPFCGIGTNLYLARLAMDVAKTEAADSIAVLTEEDYKEKFWDHTPMTDIWGIDQKTEARLHSIGVHTMRELANIDTDRLFRKFGPAAGVLIEHAQGQESDTIALLKKHKRDDSSLTSIKLLMRDYSYDEGREAVKEIMGMLCEKLQDFFLATNALRIRVGYGDAPDSACSRGETILTRVTNQKEEMVPAITDLYNRTALPDRPIRQLGITCEHVESIFLDVEDMDAWPAT